jgi:hypothetical protein
MRYLLKIAAVFVLFYLSGCSNKPPVTNFMPGEIEEAIQSQQFKFNALRMFPMSGRSRFLEGGYFLKINKGEISTNLPYFGRAYTGVYGTDAGINFESNDFDYKPVKTKKGKWTIEIDVKNNQTVRQLLLSVYPDGEADLRIIPVNKQGISYEGVLAPIQ